MIKLSKPRPKAYVAYILVALFLFYEMALQVSPSVITQQLMHDLHMQAASLGIISGVYFYSYMLMQIPSGLLFDRQSSRILIPLAILICVLGTLFFASSQSAMQAGIGRFLMGIGSSCAFISVLVISNRWFPSSYFALLVGIAQFLAAAGAMGGEAPLAIFIASFGWRQALLWLVVVGIVLAILIWLILKNKSEKDLDLPMPKQLKISQSLKQITKSGQNWWIALYAFCGWAPVAIFASLWGVPFLTKLYNIDNTLAATACAMIWMGLMFGSPLFGWYSNRYGQRRPFLIACSVLGSIASLVIVYFPGIPFGYMFILLFAFGVATSGHILTFALAKENQAPTVTATVVAFNNMAVVAGGALFQPLVGYMLHALWNGDVLDNMPVYTVNNYRYALAIIPLCFIASWVISQFFIKETYCKQIGL